MRVIHAVELFADGMAHAGVLGFLFVRNGSIVMEMEQTANRRK